MKQNSENLRKRFSWFSDMMDLHGDEHASEQPAAQNTETADPCAAPSLAGARA